MPGRNEPPINFVGLQHKPPPLEPEPVDENQHVLTFQFFRDFVEFAELGFLHPCPDLRDSVLPVLPLSTCCHPPPTHEADTGSSDNFNRHNERIHDFTQSAPEHLPPLLTTGPFWMPHVRDVEQTCRLFLRLFAATVVPPGRHLRRMPSELLGRTQIFKIDAGGTTLTILHDFVGPDGGDPYAALMQGADGYLYGTTLAGVGSGTLFKLGTDGTTFTTLHTFGADGSDPYAGVIQATDGNLYGTTSSGGMGGVGTIYRVDTNGMTFTTLHNFAITDGAYPHAGVIQAADGNLYGATTVGGANGFGTIFKIDTSGTTLTTLHHFLQTDGTSPYASLIQAADGNLYGTTINGGTNFNGTVFRIDTGGTMFTTLHYFLGMDGANPRAALIQSTDGNLYGTTLGGGTGGGHGTIFKIDPVGGTLTTVHSFINSDGADVYAGVTEGVDGNLYGTTSTGLAIKQYGTVFRIDTDGTTLTTLHVFTPFPEGSTLRAGLVQVVDGSLYGATTQGGTNGAGTLFKLDTSGTTFTTVHTFNGDGASPTGAMIQGSDGNLYGTTQEGGGSNGNGTVFRMSLDGAAFTTLHTFSGSDGSSPYAGVIQGTDGNLYGTTETGGANVNFGTIFRLDTNGASLTTLHSFAGPDGGRPFAGVIQAADGNLYGTTTSGGASGLYGTIFKIDTNGTTFTTLHDFADIDGANPYGGLVEGADGRLYGTTYVGGVNEVGTIFRIDTNGSNFETLHVFSSAEGAGPYAALIQGAGGFLYGTTTVGGPTTCASGCGTVFQIDTNGTTLTTLHGFEDSDGAGPWAGVLQTADGSLYGTTSFGGPAEGGVVFRITPCSLSQPPVITATHCDAPNTPGLTASVMGNAGDVYSWAIGGGTIDSGQGTNAITFTAGVPGTRMTLSIDESNAAGCFGAATTAVQVDFNDVPSSDLFYASICTIGRDGITVGCGSGNYCGDAAVSRGQMAVFLLKAEHGSGYAPPACTGIFADVPCTPGVGFPDWIEQLATENITGGCFIDPLRYCPDRSVRRDEMAAFLLKTEHGSGYAPPTCTGIFADVPCTPGVGFSDWIEQLANENITGGCFTDPLRYCPDRINSRGEMAVFLTKAFNLQ